MDEACVKESPFDKAHHALLEDAPGRFCKFFHEGILIN
jgi:hypothetical protein